MNGADGCLFCYGHARLGEYPVQIPQLDHDNFVSFTKLFKDEKRWPEQISCWTQGKFSNSLVWASAHRLEARLAITVTSTQSTRAAGDK